MAAADGDDVLAIYAYGLSTRNATFETRAPMSQRSYYRGVAEVGVD
jgi:hypothetical protein